MKLAKHRIHTLVVILTTSCLFGCTKYIPDDRDSFGEDISYNVTEFSPTIGRSTFYNDIVSVGPNTSQPLTFRIVNLKDADGQPVSTLFSDKFPVKVWRQMYDGTESSIEEIEAKRVVEYRPILEILEHSGNINFWNAGSSSYIRTQPDSGYTFDVEVSNSGGRRYVRGFRLKPQRERPYEPTDVDPETGLSLSPHGFASYVRGMLGQRTRGGIPASAIRVYIRKLENMPATTSKTLTLSFLDSLLNPIDPRNFNDTDWAHMVHGFNRRIEDNKVIYDVAYPIPLTRVETRYTSVGGEMARLDIGYRQRDVFGDIVRASFGYNFRIFEEGHWEIQFRFMGETPAFN
ncbi:DUF5007 domain-containing protein [Sphingobacterium griseoflavum]|uniref:DUF5007 domain-containing protein n=1 Tax=Sphingobacterium griseoflavum TaxID=1474952 RepID=A0ABQ3HTR0_9SPHI|nr:DUF5007 domain-containing protein [Sphingobacterium griseoflavum]GHE23385.1 DUF5007 domain-containing protein [Sphingobacterium griseoflavum]